MSEKQGGERGSEGDGASFDDRLRAARSRQGLDGSPPNQGRSSDPFGGSPWGIGLRVGVELVSALAIGVGIGWLLDRWLGTRPIFLGIFVLLGGAAGVLNVWRVFAPRD
jgi:ATP synthase protein I